MIEIPVVFVTTLVALIMAVAVATGTRLLCAARMPLILFLLLLAMAAALVGLRYGYGIEAVARWQPVLAMAVSPPLYLGFRAIGEDPPRPIAHLALMHGWPVVLVAAVVLVGPLSSVPLDAFVFASMGYYLVSLILLLRAGQERMIHVTAEGYRLLLPAMIAGTGLIGFVLMADLAIFIAGRLVGIVGSQVFVQVATVAVTLAMLSAAGFAAQRLARQSGGAGARPPDPPPGPSTGDHETLAALEAQLRARQLFRDSDLTLARVARRLRRPAREVSQAVNRCEGVNFSLYVNRMRVEYAQQLLATTDAPITEIMFEAGFVTKSNFNASFSRIVGKSPSQYREESARRGIGAIPKT